MNDFNPIKRRMNSNLKTLKLSQISVSVAAFYQWNLAFIIESEMEIEFEQLYF